MSTTLPPNSEKIHLGHIGWINFPHNDSVLRFLREGWFEYRERAFLSAFLRSGDSFLDIGAHVGTFSVIAQAQVGDQGWITAVEPNPAILPYLKSNLGDNCEIRTLALANTNGTAKFAPDIDTAYSHLLDDSGDAMNSIEVATSTFSSLLESLADRPLDLIKVDIEGFELELFANNQTLLKKLDSPMLVEFSHENLMRIGSSTEQLEQAIVESGYQFGKYSWATNTIVPEKLQHPVWYDNLILVKDFDRLNKKLATLSSSARSVVSEIWMNGQAAENLYIASQDFEKTKTKLQASVQNLKAQLVDDKDLTDDSDDPQTQIDQIIGKSNNLVGYLRTQCDELRQQIECNEPQHEKIEVLKEALSFLATSPTGEPNENFQVAIATISNLLIAHLTSADDNVPLQQNLANVIATHANIEQELNQLASSLTTENNNYKILIDAQEADIAQQKTVTTNQKTLIGEQGALIAELEALFAEQVSLNTNQEKLIAEQKFELNVASTTLLELEQQKNDLELTVENNNSTLENAKNILLDPTTLSQLSGGDLITKHVGEFLHVLHQDNNFNSLHESYLAKFSNWSSLLDEAYQQATTNANGLERIHNIIKTAFQDWSTAQTKHTTSTGEVLSAIYPKFSEDNSKITNDLAHLLGCTVTTLECTWEIHRHYASDWQPDNATNHIEDLSQSAKNGRAEMLESLKSVAERCYAMELEMAASTITIRQNQNFIAFRPAVTKLLESLADVQPFLRGLACPTTWNADRSLAIQSLRIRNNQLLASAQLHLMELRQSRTLKLANIISKKISKKVTDIEDVLNTI